MLAEPLALRALADLAADADARRERHVDEEAAGQGDLRGDARALGGDRLLGDLDEDAPGRASARPGSGGAFARRRASAARRRLSSLVVVIVVVVVVVRPRRRVDEIGRVEERALLGADVDERGLNAGKDCFDLAEVDVADHAAGVGAVDEELDELVVLEDGDPRLARGRIDQNFSFHRGPRL